MEAAAASVRVRRTRPPALARLHHPPHGAGPLPYTPMHPLLLHRRDSLHSQAPLHPPPRYAALASAPSRSLELRAVDQWLERVGVLEAFCAVNPKVRLHRASSLPQAEDVFTPELAPGGIVFRF